LSGGRDKMRLPSLDRDFWQLRSAEKSKHEHPDTFWIPPLEQLTSLRRGQSARLIFEVEGQNEEGAVEVQGERMWVIIAERIGDIYIGILDNQPASIEPAEGVYLCFGAEIPFMPEHVIDIGNPPVDYVDWQLGQVPERRWPRD
jgi:hypothetical protein